jgi:hypothetical protein
VSCRRIRALVYRGADVVIESRAPAFPPLMVSPLTDRGMAFCVKYLMQRGAHYGVTEDGEMVTKISSGAPCWRV